MEPTWHEYDCAVCGEHLRMTGKEWDRRGRPKTCGRSDCVRVILSRSAKTRAPRGQDVRQKMSEGARKGWEKRRQKQRAMRVSDDELALVTDRVIVSIAADPLTGRPFNAGVSWPESIRMGDRVPAGAEGPLPIADAFQRALELAVLYGFSGFVVNLDPMLPADLDLDRLAEA